VRSLSRRPDPSHRLSGRVELAPLRFDDPAGLVRSLEGCASLVNTYWIRRPRAGVTFADAVANTRVLLEAARRAGVARVVHVSVAHADAASPLAYFRHKGLAEAAVRESRLDAVIIRPTLIFGDGDILLNNIAWALRRFPAFPLADGGRAPVRPVAAADVGALAAVAARGEERRPVVDAAGPDCLAFAELVAAVRAAVGARAALVGLPGPVVAGLAAVAGALLRDTLLARDELAALRAGLLATDGPAAGTTRLADWLAFAGPGLGRAYASERARNWGPAA
jgi:NADH dehydrogenase